MGGNILLHMATLQPNRIEAMVVVTATMYFVPPAERPICFTTISSGLNRAGFEITQ